MQVAVEETGAVQRRMTVEVPGTDIDQKVESKLRELTGQVKVDGFRPGKVPLRVVRQRYGKAIRGDIIGQTVQESFEQAIGERKLQLAGAPSIDDIDTESGDSLKYTAVFEVFPEFTVNGLGDAVIKRPVAEISDEDVDKMIERLRKPLATWTAVERPAVEGDRVIADFSGTLNGETFEGGDAADVALVLGSGRMVAGFEEGLVGVVAGETRPLKLTFPEDYRVADLAGREVEFEVKVKAVEEERLPEIDAELAKQYGIESGDVAEFRQDVRENMRRELDKAIRSKIKQQVVEALHAAHDFEVPETLVEQEIDQLVSEIGQDSKPPREIFSDQAVRRVRLGLVFRELAREAELQPDPARVQSLLEEMAAAYEHPAELIEYYTGSRERLMSLENMALEEQLVDHLMKDAQVEEESSDFYSLVQPDH